MLNVVTIYYKIELCYDMLFHIMLCCMTMLCDLLCFAKFYSAILCFGFSGFKNACHIILHYIILYYII